MRHDREELLKEMPASLSTASQLVLFGSRATLLSKRTSDWDLLVVDVMPFPHRRKLDLVFLSRELLYSPLWLGSELAGHIVTYGQWLLGEPDWCAKVFPSHRALHRKARKIERRLDNLTKAWTGLATSYQAKFARAIRRDLQRLTFLVNGAAVPPTRILDDEWAGSECIPNKVQTVVSKSRVIRHLLDVVLSIDVTPEP